MTFDEDPPRLSEPGSPAPDHVQKVMAECRDDVGTPADLDGLETRLTPLLWAPPPVSSPTGAGPLGASGLLKLAAVTIAAGVAGGLFWVGTSKETPSPRPAAPMVVPFPRPPAALPQASPVVPLPVASELPATPKAKNTVTHGSAQSQSEADLLGAAQVALGQDPARALSLTEQHRTGFPRGVLSQEREVIAIEALQRLGRDGEMRARAQKFLATYPTSAHRSKIESLVSHQ